MTDQETQLDRKKLRKILGFDEYERMGLPEPEPEHSPLPQEGESQPVIEKPDYPRNDRCKACQHLGNPGIDRMLREGATLKDILKTYEGLSKSGLSRHRIDCLKAQALTPFESGQKGFIESRKDRYPQIPDIPEYGPGSYCPREDINLRDWLVYEGHFLIPWEADEAIQKLPQKVRRAILEGRMKYQTRKAEE